MRALPREFRKPFHVPHDGRCSEAIALDSTQVGAHRTRAEAYTRLGRTAAAAADFKRLGVEQPLQKKKSKEFPATFSELVIMLVYAIGWVAIWGLVFKLIAELSE